MRMIAILVVFLLNCGMSQEMIEQKPVKPWTYLALGDSYTIGEAVEIPERWPKVLEERSQNTTWPIDSVRIIARTGWTTAELQKGISDAQLSGQTFDLVSLLIGVNNQFRGYDTAIYVREFEALLQQAIDFAAGDISRVFVLSIPDYGVTPFSKNRNPEKIAKEIDQYNTINKRISERVGVSYFDITPISREATKIPSLIAKDGLHPSGAMYKRWIDEVVMPVLNKKYQ